MTTPPQSDDAGLPSMDELEAARESQQARTLSIEELLELKRQARNVAMNIILKGAGAAVGAAGLTIPDELIGKVSEAVVDKTIDFLEGLASGTDS